MQICFQSISYFTAHLQDLDDHLLIVGDVDGLEHLAVLPSAQLTNQLVVLLVAIGTDGETQQSMCECVRKREKYFQRLLAINSVNELLLLKKCSSHGHKMLPWGLK